MNPTDRLAALKLLSAAIAAEIKEAEAAALDWMRATRAKTAETDWGTVTRTWRKPTISVDDDEALLAWFEEQAPSEIIRTVRPAAKKAFIESLTLDGGCVVTKDGEVIDWAHVSEPTEGLMTRNSAESKESATALLRGRLAAILALPAPGAEVES